MKYLVYVSKEVCEYVTVLADCKEAAEKRAVEIAPEIDFEGDPAYSVIAVEDDN